MTNKPKRIGTAAESKGVKFLHSIGYDPTTALRKTLSGASDVGDVWCHHASGTIVIEVKGGDAANSASHNQIRTWLAEAVREARNSRIDARLTPVLVTQTRGIGSAGGWKAWMWASDLLGFKPESNGVDYPIQMRLADLMTEFEPRG